MSQNAFDVGAPIPTVNAAVEARLLSALKSERVVASEVLPGPLRSCPAQPDRSHQLHAPGVVRGKDHLLRARHGALAAGIAGIQVRHRSRRGGQNLAGRMHHPCGAAVRCSRAFGRNPGLVNLMLDESFSESARVGATGAARRRADGSGGRYSRSRLELVAGLL